MLAHFPWSKKFVEEVWVKVREVVGPVEHIPHVHRPSYTILEHSAHDQDRLERIEQQLALLRVAVTGRTEVRPAEPRDGRHDLEFGASSFLHLTVAPSRSALVALLDALPLAAAAHSPLQHLQRHAR